MSIIWNEQPEPRSNDADDDGGDWNRERIAGSIKNTALELYSVMTINRTHT